MIVPVAQKRQPQFGPESNGILMTPEEFDRADFEDFEEGWRYELINGVLIVTPIAAEAEADPNGELEYWLRSYRENHPEGSALDATLPERIVRTGKNRRRADWVIWAGLGRRPRRFETPTIIVEFVSKRKRDRVRDYETKRDEYLNLGVKEYWIIDRFQRILSVFSRKGGKVSRRVVREQQTYKPALLPGFELPLSKSLARADRWADVEDETD
jgi:Uma2 family endonuclease